MNYKGNLPLPSEQLLHGTSPLISQATAHALSALFTVTYVLPFYLFRRTRPSPTLTRDAPDVIRARITLVSIACCVCASITLGILFQRTYDDDEWIGLRGRGSVGDSISRSDVIIKTREGGGGLSLTEAARLLGWWPVVLPDVARVMVLTGILFAGPLFEAGIVEGGWRWWGRWDPVRRVLGSWTGVRNFIAGPLSEEFIFRSLILTLHVLSYSPSSFPAGDSTISIPSPPPSIPLRFLLLLPPFYFAIAHIHHYYEFRLTHPRIGAGPALARSALQFSYTSLFGAYAGFVFLRTGSLSAVVLAHTFCNWIGLPRFWGWVGGDYGNDIINDDDDDDDINNDDDDDDDYNSSEDGDGKKKKKKRESRRRRREERMNKRKGIKVKVLVLATTMVYYSLLVAGAVGFYIGLYPFTRSDRAIVLFEK